MISKNLLNKPNEFIFKLTNEKIYINTFYRRKKIKNVLRSEGKIICAVR